MALATLAERASVLSSLDVRSTEELGFAFGKHMLDAPIGYDPE